MKMNLYAVYDTKAQAYGMLFPCSADGVAMRHFAEKAKDKNSVIGKYPEDHVLFHLGVYDDESGKIEGVTPRSLCCAVQYVEEVR